ncbi:preprotein translocase subunit SecA [Epidermidibacterium keratini]|uniref:Protein translocase subunit SecA n=1 Tax=Epidermidibacterium keratini TaxID=1891644 RepID=A0A7L4YQZ3_9ACTN|nr:preprotein translocase subunit SecA [Epidermidibacterium keratini]QHC01566.1 preprotein translocase subunit SecA [Epidermidibacterium keratini]
MVLARILRAGEGKILRRLRTIADAVDSIEDDYVDLTDAELQAKTDEFKQRFADGETLDDLMPEAFAVVREASSRTLGQRHYNVQLQGGAALHLGNVAEMKTGEGKTLVSTLPAYLNALSGEGVHIVTVNDYLAKRDAEWMGRVHRFLGLEVGTILAGDRPDQRREQYAADITYGTNNEFGFDYLRDNMAWSAEGLVQRGHNFAIVDEVDSILVDEARTPLIISGPAEHSTRWYLEFARLAPLLKKNRHYEVEEGKRTVAITEEGVEFVEDQLGIDNLYESVNTPLIGYLNNSLKAKELFKKDKDYIVNSGEVLIVDEFTGRVLQGRRYNEGMHQAIEAKERVEIKQENQTLATITLQNYFRQYDKLAGMTGTAQTEAAELSQTYKLGVVPIPTNKPMQRVDHADIIYKTESAKFTAVVDDIAEAHDQGQPVLVGTTSVEKSELLAKMLTRKGIAHEVLNAKQHEREAHIVAEAGRLGAVTVATNMAGRGTDIKLGGDPEHIADLRLRERGLNPTDTPEEYEAAWDDELEKATEETEAEHGDVLDAGGLYVLGTERHESRRIDNQLRGRSGRQGDPGKSRFYLSMHDDLMRRSNGEMLEAMLNRLRLPDDVPIESKWATRSILSAQTQIEQQNHEIRKNVLKYDEVMNQQREVIYGERRRVLHGEDLSEQINGMMHDVVADYVEGATSSGYAEEWDLDQLWTALGTLYPVALTQDDVIESAGSRGAITPELLRDEITADIESAYEAREESLGEERMRDLERQVVLSVLDRKWREHLYEMDYLREGIHLRAMAQRDPVTEYKREGFEMFNTMLEAIKEESVGFLFNVEAPAADAPGAAAAPAAAAPAAAAPAAAAPAASTEDAGEAAPAQKTAKPAAPRKPSKKRRVIASRTGAGAAAGSGSASASGGSGTTTATKEKPATGPDQSAFVLSGPAEGGGTETKRGNGVPAKGKAAAGSGSGAGAGKSGPSRNGPCPCGSGKKYKRCHGAEEN